MSRSSLIRLEGEPLARYLQLVSPVLPVGAFSYSHGLEWAIEEGTVHDRESAAQWIHDNLHFGIGRFEGPVWWRLYRCWQDQDCVGAARWNAYFCASRETAELRAESLQMGQSLHRLVRDAGLVDKTRLGCLERLESPSYPAVFSLVAAHWGIPPRQGLLGYLWSWAENQTAAAMKGLPLGQVAGQKTLSQLAEGLPALVEEIIAMDDAALSNFLPALAIASSRHETQYSRIFRS